MNQKLISRLVVGALATIAAASSFAGQIQSSSLSIAREVITTDTQAVNAPTITYRFSGDVNATSQAQTFQIQFVLGGGAKWATAGNSAANTLASPAVPDSNIVIVPQAGANAGQQLVAADYSVDALALSADKTTLYATITIKAGRNIGQPQISLAVAAGTKPTVNNLYTVVQAVTECDTSVKTLPVSVKHYTALTSPASLATDSNATPDEHVRSGATNTATLVTFPTNILVQVTKSVGNAKLDISGGNVGFSGSGASVAPDANNQYQSYISATKVNLGYVSLKQNANGNDSDVSTPYLISDAGAPAPGILAGATAVQNTGKVEVKQFDIKVSASQGFVVGGSLFLSSDLSSCAAAVPNSTVAITSSNAAGPITLTLDTANVAGALSHALNAPDHPVATVGNNPVHVCYSVPGNVIIPGSSFNIDAATLVKAAAGTDLNEQNNFCKGPLYALSGSLKIDVRNYASNARKDGWLSVLRLINNSETRTVDVYGQYILATGLYGKWGKVATLAPRAVVNLTPDVVDSKLTSLPAHPTAANNDATGIPSNAGDAPRLRITSDNGDTLRVQNYLYNPASQNFIEASGSQGVDFTGTTNRAPASEGQYQDQDAQVGLNGGN
ncbi:hypothetical protein SAMN02745857_03501 [Andreprevotia lacus DSM 23236]|jgi:hypothetical protein|uniref:Uncharacterized protein n=1 Tax=Andreprevotia lacus DSM 23236 TaxID=1121001 RepID=A0A1W1XYB3_9NEIS|nr:hypothetical protein [Andreprevotia lacus]SMC28949.1 hypothetical protein SAMN02745857_03501 [Andreprevotia lacus DSM 23236]